MSTSLSPDSVMVPIDMVSFDNKYFSAMRKAFGMMAIASGNNVSESLAQKFGLKSVTLDGKISGIGTITGGWDGWSDAGKSVMSLKHDMDKAAVSYSKA